MQDSQSTGVIRDILSWEDPHLVIFTGDQVTAGQLQEGNATDYIHLLLQPLVQGRYRWASAYGNHDGGPNLPREAILAAEQSYGDLCFTQNMTPDLGEDVGVTNYFVPVFPPTGSRPVMLLWFFDSRGGLKVPFYVDPKVVQWFRKEVARLRELWGPLPSFAFMHIPPEEYASAQDGLVHNKLCGGLSDQRVKPQEKNTGILRALLDAGGLQTVFVGHNHGNSWCCYFEDAELCFNRKSGYGSYGNWTKGARVIQLEWKGPGRGVTQKNYVRLETGEIVDRFPNRM